MLQFCDCISRMPNTVTFFFFGRRLFFFFWFRKQKCCDVLQLLRVSLNPFSIDISDSALLSLSLSSPVFFFLLFHVAFCLFVHLFVFFRAALLFSRFVFFFFSVECALHLSLVVRISSRGALQKEKVAIADLHLFLSFFFFCLFVCLLF